MKHIFTLLFFLAIMITVHAQTASMIERDKPGVGFSAGMQQCDYMQGLSLNVGYKFNQKVDISATVGRDYPYYRNGLFSSPYFVNYIGVEASYWLLNKEVGSDALLKAGVLGGALLGDLCNENHEVFYFKNLIEVQGFGGLGVLLNYNPDNGFFIIQPSLAIVYTAGKNYYYYAGECIDSEFVDQVMATAGLSFGFKLKNGSVLSFNVEQAMTNTLVDPHSFGLEFAYPVK